MNKEPYMNTTNELRIEHKQAEARLIESKDI